jgi:hypothetical protein
MIVSYNHLIKFRDGESWKGHCTTRDEALWEELKESNLGEGVWLGVKGKE